MRHILVSALGLGLVCEIAGAQRPDTTTFTRPQGTARGPRAAPRREAESRRRRVDYIDSRAMGRQAGWLAERRGIGTHVLTSGDGQTTYLLVRRDTSSQPEVHARWDDLVIVRSGTGAVEFGDSLVGSRYRAPGERVGGSIAKSHRLVVHAGDVVRIPAAVPHAFIVSGPDPLEYLVVKQRRKELPIRWTASVSAAP